jgi:hypothetical protein
VNRRYFDENLANHRQDDDDDDEDDEKEHRKNYTISRGKKEIMTSRGAYIATYVLGGRENCAPAAAHECVRIPGSKSEAKEAQMLCRIRKKEKDEVTQRAKTKKRAGKRYKQL